MAQEEGPKNKFTNILLQWEDQYFNMGLMYFSGQSVSISLKYML